MHNIVEMLPDLIAEYGTFKSRAAVQNLYDADMLSIDDANVLIDALNSYRALYSRPAYALK